MEAYYKELAEKYEERARKAEKALAGIAGLCYGINTVELFNAKPLKRAKELGEQISERVYEVLPHLKKI